MDDGGVCYTRFAIDTGCCKGRLMIHRPSITQCPPIAAVSHDKIWIHEIEIRNVFAGLSRGYLT